MQFLELENKARILEIFSDHGPITIIPTYRLEHLEQNLNSVHQKSVFIHTVTNNVPGCRNLVVLAKKFCQICLEFRARRPNTRIFAKIIIFYYLFVVVDDSAIVNEILNVIEI